MVSVSVAALLVSAMATPTNGSIAASAVVVWAVGVGTVMVGATAASLSVTVMELLLALVPAELKSLSVKVVVVLEPRAPMLGVKTSASKSAVTVPGAAVARV